MLIVDGHVHIYNCFNRQLLFDSAYKNMEEQARRLQADTFCGILLLVERSDQNEFISLADALAAGESPQFGDWHLMSTDEPSSLRISSGSRSLSLLMGRQLISSEGLEVLALLCDSSMDEGLPLAEQISHVRQAGGIVVLPWAFGKWFGKRGTALKTYLEQEAPVLLGDNGGRPHLYTPQLLFRSSQKHSLPLVSGSDPLPIPGEERRVGSFGFSIDTPADIGGINQQLRDLLGQTPMSSHATLNIPLKPYGRGLPIIPFLRNQVLLRIGQPDMGR